MCYAKSPRGSHLHFLLTLSRLGGKLHPLEWLLFYFAFPILFYCHTQAELSTLFWTNAWRQIVLFALVVQLPLFFTGHMIYVDIGWPFGLCVLAMTAFDGPGWIGRRYTIMDPTNAKTMPIDNAQLPPVETAPAGGVTTEGFIAELD